MSDMGAERLLMALWEEQREESRVAFLAWLGVGGLILVEIKHLGEFTVGVMNVINSAGHGGISSGA